MHVEVINQVRDIPADDWNRVSGIDHPFTRHEFLLALEQHNCVGEAYGWLPRHLVAFDADATPVGIMPLYLKDNSYGEFVFDWAWAEAWQRAGRPYYPKLVSSIPYTPVTGSRLLVRPDAARDAVTAALVEHALKLLERTAASSLHCLFTDARDTKDLVRHGLLRRTGCHFHWHNNSYSSFEDFLSSLTSRKRKKIRRERRYVQEAGIRMEVLYGSQATENQWVVMHEFYRSTFEKKSGIPTLSLEFFLEISRTMGQQLVLVFAFQDQRPVAGAIMLRSGDALYGRHWGCRDDFHSLHFETCYYQGIEYCIDHGLSLFEPGAQGEHKISRGFLPTLTWSAHWIADAQFRTAIEKYLAHEHEMIVNYHEDLQRYSPFRKASENDPK